MLTALSWIIGSLVTISTVSIVAHARLSSIGKAIIGSIIAVTILAFIVPEKNPLIVLGGLGLLNVAVRSLRMREPSIILSLIALLASVCVIGAVNVCFSGGEAGFSGNIVENIQANVAKRWEKIAAECDRAVDCYRRNAKPGAKPAPPAKDERKQLHRVRQLLLPVDCRDVLAAVDDLDGKLVAVRQEIVKAEGERVRHPDESEKYDARIQAVMEDL